MAKAFRCDACKQFRDGEPHVLTVALKRRGQASPVVSVVELCDQCQEAQVGHITTRLKGGPTDPPTTTFPPPATTPA